MKAVTHNLFSVGVEVYFVSVVRAFWPSSLLLGAWLAVSTGFVIDALGHSGREGMSVRSWATHSVLTAPLWGAFIGLSTPLVATSLLRVTPDVRLLGFSALLGVLAAYSHLLLDSLTEGGVFALRHRIAIAHFGNNNLVLNSAFSLFGIVLCLAGLGFVSIPIP